MHWEAELRCQQSEGSKFPSCVLDADVSVIPDTFYLSGDKKGSKHSLLKKELMSWACQASNAYTQGNVNDHVLDLRYRPW